MTIDDKIRDKKLQYDISKENLKILALWSGKFDDYLTIKLFRNKQKQLKIKEKNKSKLKNFKITGTSTTAKVNWRDFPKRFRK